MLAGSRERTGVHDGSTDGTEVDEVCPSPGARVRILVRDLKLLNLLKVNEDNVSLLSISTGRRWDSTGDGQWEGLGESLLPQWRAAFRLLRERQLVRDVHAPV